MILLWVTLLVLHQGYSLVPVTTVRLGEPATFTCALHYKESDRPQLDWYKQSAGETLKLIVTKHKSTKPAYAPEFSESRLEMNNDNNFSNLTILRTIQEDEGMYHCASMEWLTSPVWSGTYLLIKGNSESEPNITAIIQDHPSVPLHPGDSVTLQCSVLSDSEKKTCPGEHSVFWFRAGSDESHPSLIYAHGNRGDECEKSPEAYSPQKCVYNFSKNVSSSDAGTYYCAVATCGEILFGSGTKLDIEAFNVWDLQKANTVLFVLCAALAISLIIIAFLIYTIKKKTCDCCSAADLQTNAATASGDQQSQQRATDLLAYSAPTFNKRKTGRAERRNVKTAEEETIYTDVRTLQFVKAFCMAVVRTRSKVTCNSYTDRHKLWWAISPPFDQPSRLFTQNRPDFGLQQDV
ncbi:uncharacterized protein LOC144524135 isoform X4 [Sander vitreus]